MPKTLINACYNIYSCFLNLVQWYQLQFRSSFVDSGRNILNSHRCKMSCMWLNKLLYQWMSDLSSKFLFVAMFIISDAHRNYSQNRVFVIMKYVYMFIYLHTSVRIFSVRMSLNFSNRT
jgi:hypothetical protein